MINFRNLINFIAMFFSITVVFSQSSRSHKSAIEMTFEDIQSVGKVLRIDNHQDSDKSKVDNWVRTKRIDYNTKNEVCVWKNDDIKRIIVSYPDVKSLNPFYKFWHSGADMVDADSYGVQGKVYRKVFDLENSLHEEVDCILRKNEEYDYIFTGYGLGGAAAVLAASRFTSNMNLDNNLDNKIKVINFSSIKVGDNDLIEGITQKITLKNILHFIPHYSISHIATSHIGIPLEITSLEGFYDGISRRSVVVGIPTMVGALLAHSSFHQCNNWCNLFAGLLGSSIVGSAYYLYTWPSIPSDMLIDRVFSYAKERNRRSESDEEKLKIGKIGWFEARN